MPLGYVRADIIRPGEWFEQPVAVFASHVNPMEQLPNQLPQKLPILRYTRQTKIEVLSGVIYIYQPMLPAKFYCFTVAKTNAAISLERVNNAIAAVFTSSSA